MVATTPTAMHPIDDSGSITRKLLGVAVSAGATRALALKSCCEALAGTIRIVRREDMEDMQESEDMEDSMRKVDMQKVTEGMRKDAMQREMQEGAEELPHLDWEGEGELTDLWIRKGSGW